MCDDFLDFDDLGIEDLAIISAVLGFVEEQIEEEEKIQKEIEGEIPDEDP